MYMKPFSFENAKTSVNESSFNISLFNCRYIGCTVILDEGTVANFKMYYCSLQSCDNSITLDEGQRTAAS